MQRAGREATDAELAAAAGVGVDQIRAGRTAVLRCRAASLDQPEISGRAADQISDAALTGLAQVEDRPALAQAVELLSERERRLVELRYIRQLSQQQIGHELGLSQMQISRLLHALRHKMRAALQPWEQFDAEDHQQAG